jgi:hypothetical protein
LLPAFFLWLPLIAIAAHLFEEFVWPGGSRAGGQYDSRRSASRAIEMKPVAAEVDEFARRQWGGSGRCRNAGSTGGDNQQER